MNVVISKAEAVAYSFALDEAQKRLVSELGRIERKRKLTVAQKVLLAQSASQALKRITELNDRIQRAAEIRGY
jgi:hypothetical protein